MRQSRRGRFLSSQLELPVDGPSWIFGPTMTMIAGRQAKLRSRIPALGRARRMASGARVATTSVLYPSQQCFRGCEAGRVRTRGMGERRWKALRSTEDPSLDEPTAAAVESGRRRLHVQSTKRNLTSSFSRHHFNPRLLLRPPNTDCFNMRTSSETILLALALVATAVKAELKVEVYDGPKECEDHQRVQIGNYLSMVNIYLLRRNSFCLIRKKKI